MDKKYPQRLYRIGNEPRTKQVNNGCKMPFLDHIKDEMPLAYSEVQKDAVFGPILAIYENNLKFSGRLVHCMLSRQLVTKKKHEMWFAFGKKPLRFSMQEFHAVTGLKCQDDFDYDIEEWTDDGGFWSNVIRNKEKVWLHKIKKEYLPIAHSWEPEDRVRLVYISLIAAILFGFSDLKVIPMDYIELVMDIKKAHKYPWGRLAYDHLLKYMRKRKVELKNPVSFSLEGFSYALQIWAMEAIPFLGKIAGYKISDEFKFPRCSNWTGNMRPSFDAIITVEKSLGRKGCVYPYISETGDFDVVDSVHFLRTDEIEDVEVDNLKNLIKSGYDFIDFSWECVEKDDVLSNEKHAEEEHDDTGDYNDCSQEDNEVRDASKDLTDGLDSTEMKQAPNVVGAQSSEKKKGVNVQDSCSKNKKKKLGDVGAETRKRKFLCQRSAAYGESLQQNSNEEMKSFLKGLFDSSFMSFTEQIDMRLDKFKGEVVTRLDKLEGEVLGLRDSISTSGVQTEKTSQKSNPTSGVQTEKTSQESNLPKVSQKFGEEEYEFDEIFTPHIDLNMSTQEFLREKLGHLSPETQVPKDDTLPVGVDELRLKYQKNPGKDDEDAILVFFSEERFEAYLEWSKIHSSIQLGPTLLDMELLNRVMGPKVWLKNYEMDAAMYRFREFTSLGRMNSERVGFMDCVFSMNIQKEYEKYRASNKKAHSWDQLLPYANGDLPCHGKTRKKWAIDVDRIYAPICINNNHWISICVNFELKSVEVFDCYGFHNRRYAEPFAIAIPHILKEAHGKINGKVPLLAPYRIEEHRMLPNLNKSGCDCGVYAVKHIECHFLNLSLDLINDDNIHEARYRLAIDLWEAASDPVLIDRMKLFEPRKSSSQIVDIE